MRRHNPAVIPRNHRVEAALEAATIGHDLEPMRALMHVLATPYGNADEGREFSEPGPAGVAYRTFCGYLIDDGFMSGDAEPVTRITKRPTHECPVDDTRKRPVATERTNGYRMRTWDTRVGTIELAIPKVRPGTYFPSLLQPRRRADTRCWRLSRGRGPCRHRNRRLPARSPTPAAEAGNSCQARAHRRGPPRGLRLGLNAASPAGSAARRSRSRSPARRAGRSARRPIDAISSAIAVS